MFTTLHRKPGVETSERSEPGSRNQKVPADIAHQPFHLPLIVPLARTAEPGVEQVVGRNAVNARVSCRFPSPVIRATASLVLSCNMLWGTPPKNVNADT